MDAGFSIIMTVKTLKETEVELISIFDMINIYKQIQVVEEKGHVAEPHKIVGTIEIQYFICLNFHAKN